jgi:hypothetical protein
MTAEIIIFAIAIIIAIALLWTIIYREIHILFDEIKGIKSHTITSETKLKKLISRAPFVIYLAKDDFGEYAFFSMPTWSDTRNRWVCSDNRNYLELSSGEIQRLIGRKLGVQECPIEYTI